MNPSHALSEKTVKKMGLDKIEEPSPLANEEVVKEWSSRREYWDDFENEILQRREKFLERVKDFFVYGIGWRFRDWWWNTKWYFRNLKTFQPVLKSWKSFDYHYQVDLFKFGIEQLIKAKEKYGNEYKPDSDKRVGAMKALIAEIERDYDKDVRQRLHYNFMDDKARVIKYSDGSVLFEDDKSEERKAETENFYRELAKERKAHYQKIFDLIIGQDQQWIIKEVDRRYNELSEEDKKVKSEHEIKHDLYNEIWDGSGIEGWWD